MSHFAIPEHVFTGKDALTEACPYFKSYGSHAMIVTGPHVGKSPMIAMLKKALELCEISYTIFDGITGEPTDTMIALGTRIYKEEGCDFCIGIGGGSPLDSAKAIAAMSVLEGSIADYNGKELAGAVIPPICAIPTTAGTGSEATKFTIITDTEKDIKMLLKGDSLVPKLAIVNSDFMMDMPKRITASTGLDALTHAIEAYTSKKAMPLTDIFAEDAVKRIMAYLPVAYINGMDAGAREEMAIAAMEAGFCINNSSVTLVHGMSRPIGALFHVPHGLSNAMLLGDCLGFALSGAYGKFAKLGRICGITDDPDDEAAAKAFLGAVKEVIRICEVPTIRAYGIDPKIFEAVTDKMATDAMASGSPGNTIREVTKEDCIALYKKVCMR